jgi:hypothetical protein
MKALVYRNTSRDDEKNKRLSHYLQISFKGDKQNLNGWATLVNIYYDKGKQQVYENNPYRGYLVVGREHRPFWFRKSNKVDSVIIKWPNGKQQKLLNVKADQKSKRLPTLRIANIQRYSH